MFLSLPETFCFSVTVILVDTGICTIKMERQMFLKFSVMRKEDCTFVSVFVFPFVASFTHHYAQHARQGKDKKSHLM